MNADRIPVIVPPAELTDASLPGFEEVIEVHLTASGPGVVLDLAEVTFINSTGLGCLVKIGMRLDRQHRRLALARPERKVERMLRMLGLDSKMPVFKSLDDAAGFVTRDLSVD
jgi:anti-sigma B factor antagonist